MKSIVVLPSVLIIDHQNSVAFTAEGGSLVISRQLLVWKIFFWLHNTVGSRILNYNCGSTVRFRERNKNTSMPVIPSGIYLHMPIPLGCIPINGLRDVHYQNFSLFGLGANPLVLQNRRWLATHPGPRSKFHRPASTQDGDIRYKIFVDKQRNSKQYIPTMPTGMWL